MISFFTTLLFIAIGVLGGIFNFRKTPQTSCLANILWGITGSMIIPYGMKLLGLDMGLTTPSVVGILLGVVGALLFPWFYGVISAKYQNRPESKPSQRSS